MSQQAPKMKIILRSSDEIDIAVDQDAAFQSNLLRHMIANLKIDNPDSPLLKEPLPVSTVTGVVLKKIIDWCNDHRLEQYRIKEEFEDPRVQLTRYDELYLDVDSDMLVDILLGANYLDIPGLIDIVTQKIANIGNGKTVEQLRQIYMLENDLTPEQEEEIKKRFEWVEK